MRHSLCSPLMRRTENMSCSRAVIFPSGFSCDAKKCSFPPFRLSIRTDRSFYEDSHKMTKEVGCDKQGLKAKRPSSLLFPPPSLPSFQSQGPSTCDVCPTFRRPFASRAAPPPRRRQTDPIRQTVSLLKWIPLSDILNDIVLLVAHTYRGCKRQYLLMEYFITIVSQTHLPNSIQNNSIYRAQPFVVTG